MSTQPIPAGCHSVTPYLTVADAKREIDFLVNGLGCVARELIHRPDGKIMHAQVMLGDSLIMIGESPDATMKTTSNLYHYVPDCDATWKRAVAAGGEVVNEPADMFYGDRTGAVKDPGGNSWWIATHKEELTTKQIEERMAAMFK
jgi:PhnB protein